jgi:hypothetical protein
MPTQTVSVSRSSAGSAFHRSITQPPRTTTSLPSQSTPSPGVIVTSARGGCGEMFRYRSARSAGGVPAGVRRAVVLVPRRRFHMQPAHHAVAEQAAHAQLQLLAEVLLFTLEVPAPSIWPWKYRSRRSGGASNPSVPEPDVSVSVIVPVLSRHLRMHTDGGDDSHAHPSAQPSWSWPQHPVAVQPQGCAPPSTGGGSGTNAVSTPTVDREPTTKPAPPVRTDPTVCAGACRSTSRRSAVLVRRSGGQGTRNRCACAVSGSLSGSPNARSGAAPSADPPTRNRLATGRTAARRPGLGPVPAPRRRR